MGTALRDAEVKSLGVGTHGDGDGLYLIVQPNGRRSWIFRYQLNKRRRDMGLGSYPLVSLKEARLARNAARAAIAQGIDPIDARHEENASKAAIRRFDELALEYIATHKHSWKNEKHVKQWEATLTTYASPEIGSKDVADITTDDVLAVLKPIWKTKAETASRVRGRIEKVLDYATVKKLRHGDNPARWKGHLEVLLPSGARTKKHYPALPYSEAPAFFKKLQGIEAVSSLALQWVMLCGCRTNEALRAKWSEIDTENSLWKIPEERMKARREHIVPITKEMQRVLKKAKALKLNDWIFPSSREGKSLSSMAMTMLMRQHAPGYVPHGMRSTITDWFHEQTEIPNEVVEIQLAHAVGTKVEQAYRRGNALQKRFDAMNLWATYLAPSATRRRAARP